MKNNSLHSAVNEKVMKTISLKTVKASFITDPCQKHLKTQTPYQY